LRTTARWFFHTFRCVFPSSSGSAESEKTFPSFRAPQRRCKRERRARAVHNVSAYRFNWKPHMSLLSSANAHTHTLAEHRRERKFLKILKFSGKIFINTHTATSAGTLSLENVLTKKPCVRPPPTPHPTSRLFCHSQPFSSLSSGFRLKILN
jgi:hypothetical protein